MVNNTEKVLNKIKNLLDLANNNPNENEAIAAALKAQELMAKYDITTADLDNGDEEEMYQTVYRDSGKHEMKKWKYTLASVIAKNFRCKYYVLKNCGIDVVFYGYKKDAKIAVEVFKFLYESGNKFATRYYNKCKKENRNTRGIMNTYLMGFCAGIKDVLDKQCTALMIVVPKEVEDSFTEMTATFGTIKTTLRQSNDSRAYDEGRREGKNTATARGIE